MKVSVVIPAYNAAATVADTINSVIAQTTPDWEVIVVNDGSTDNTAAVVAAMMERDARIRSIAQANGGESAARNAGIAQARYEWLLFLDADDWIAPTHLNCLLDALERDPALDAIHCGWVRVSNDGTEIPETYRPPTGDLFPVLARRAVFPVHACLIRRSLVEAAGGLDVTLRKSPDWDLWQRIARAGANFGSVPDVLAYYRMAPNSASLEAEQMLVDGMKILRRGHARDPRVPNPLPQYADGLAGSTVESQEYYLLCWCAGLLLGSGTDAVKLLQHVDGDRYTGLYANAIAQCIFEAATLPSCRPRHAWEELWPQVGDKTAAFLIALEAESQTKDLASQSLTELKKLILKNSPVWGTIIDHEETTAAQLQDTISKLTTGSTWLQGNRDEWRRRAEELERSNALLSANLSAQELHTNELEAANTTLQATLQASIHQTEEYARTTDALRQELLEAGIRDGTLVAQNDSLAADLQAALRQSEELELQHAATSRELATNLSLTADLQAALRNSEELELLRAAMIGDLTARNLSLTAELQVALRQVETLDLLQAATIRELTAAKREIADLERKGSLMDAELTETRTRIQVLEVEKEHLRQELEKWRQSATARAHLIEDLQNDAWMRFGLWLRMTQRRELEPATLDVPTIPEAEGEPDLPADPARWNLRVADGSEANAIYPREDHQMVKIGINKAGTKTAWDIQLNRLGLKATGGVTYAVSFRGRSTRPRTIGLGFAKAHAPWSSLGMYKKLRLTPEWQVFREEFIALEDDEDARIHFDLGGSKIGVDLTSISLRVAEPAGVTHDTSIAGVAGTGRNS